jgi:hypothetical protein
MNERIKELARMSGFTVDETGTFTEFAEMTRLDCFAELIVKECAKFLDENSGYDECNNSWHPQPEDLLQHFGVEE